MKLLVIEDDPDLRRQLVTGLNSKAYTVEECADGKEIEGAGEGNLVIKDSWPGQSRSIWGDHERFGQTYFIEIHLIFFRASIDGAN